MDSTFRQKAVDSLKDLESYYQSRYEYYLAKATEASEYKERVKLLILDLLKQTDYLEHQTVVKNRSLNSPSFLQETQELLDEESLTQLTPEKEQADNENRNQPLELNKIKQLLLDLSTAMEAIEFASQLDSGKSLHRSYLHQILNRKLSQELSVEIVDLYLDEAVNRGLIKPDQFNNQCYIALTVSSATLNGSQPSNGHKPNLPMLQQESVLLTAEVNSELKRTDEPKNKPQSSATTKKHHNLPNSPRLKPTLLETVEQYIKACNPRRFSSQDIVDYLYPQKQQTKWSRNKAQKVRVSISNVLSRQVYLDKYWSRIEPGVYQPGFDW